MFCLSQGDLKGGVTSCWSSAKLSFQLQMCVHVTLKGLGICGSYAASRRSLCKHVSNDDPGSTN